MITHCLHTSLDLYRKHFAAAAAAAKGGYVVDLSICLWLTELYHRTKDPAVLGELDSRIGLLEEHQPFKLSTNYTLTGSLGPGMLYCMLYHTTGQRRYLDKAIETGRRYFEGFSFRYGIISRTGLLDGLAGILLFTMCLYRYTTDGYWFEKMEWLTTMLISRCKNDATGIYWGGITNKEESNLGLYSGTAGVAIVLCLVSDSFRQPLLKDIADRALDYELARRCENGDGGVILLAGLLGRLPQDHIEPYTSGDEVRDAADAVRRSWYGLVLTVLHTLTEATRYETEIISIRHRIGTWLRAQREGAEAGAIIAAGVFFTYADMPDNGERSLLSASLAEVPKGEVKDNTAFYRAYANRYFRRTLAFMEKEMPSRLQKLYADTPSTDMDRFAKNLEYALSECNGEQEIPLLLTNLFIAEKHLLAISQSDKKWMIDDDAAIEQLYHRLQLPAEEFVHFVLVKSPDVIFFKLRPQPAGNAGSASIGDILKNYGQDTVACNITDHDELDMFITGVLQIVLDLFEQPVSVGGACEQIVQSLMNQPESALPALMTEFRVNDICRLREAIRARAWDGIRYCYMSGLLKYVDYKQQL